MKIDIQPEEFEIQRAAGLIIQNRRMMLVKEEGFELFMMLGNFVRS